jgi:glutamate racemase
MHVLPNKPHITILVTDSGLGGLSICADLVNNLVSQGAAGELSVIYFNAWPLQNKGYNNLAGDRERIRVFGNAVSAMNRYNPDLILIACNTLSVVFHQGKLAGKVLAPVMDIINFGVDMIADRLNGHPDSTVLILGTKTTVASQAHKKGLAKRGVSGNRIVQQNCHGLAGAIERDPDSPEVKSMVDRFMAEAAAGLAPGTKYIFAALCCTHYGYCQALIRKTLARHTGAEVQIINPNQAMSGQVSPGYNRGRPPSVNLEVKVVSRVRLAPQKIGSIATRIENISPHTAQALRDYKRSPDLFEV